jgi:uncharacterized protein (DUF1499 family)
VETSRVATTARGVGILSVLLLVGAPLAIQADVLDPALGFRLFAGSLLLGLLAVLLGLIGVVRTRVATGRGGRSAAVLGASLGFAVVAFVLVLAAPSGDLPIINDVSTDLEDPPAFRAATELPGNAGRDLGYPAEFADPQRQGYPDLAPLAVASPPSATLDRVADIARGFGWKITARDDATGTLEATETSRVFRFVDDVVVRVQPVADGSLVDVRSKSREGRGDLGANAARIRRLLDALKTGNAASAG